MNLIANSGIQFYTIPLEIDLDDNFKMHFHEWFDVNDEQLKLEIAHNFPEDDIWVSKKDIYRISKFKEIWSDHEVIKDSLNYSNFMLFFRYIQLCLYS